MTYQNHWSYQWFVILKSMIDHTEEKLGVHRNSVPAGSSIFEGSDSDRNR